MKYDGIKVFIIIPRWQSSSSSTSSGGKGKNERNEANGRRSKHNPWEGTSKKMYDIWVIWYMSLKCLNVFQHWNELPSNDSKVQYGDV